MKEFFPLPLPEPVGFAIDSLNAAGFEAYAVGGCVRDHVMGRTPGDYDVTTSARPEQMLKVFSDCRIIETGLKHGTLTLVRDGMNIEITTYRIDGAYTDSRHPDSVTFTNELAEDLARRDFTINAMAYSPVFGIIDLNNGLEDIKNKKISCVGEAVKRFSEDGLRILRALRFSSVLGFTPDRECSDGIRGLSGLLEKISRERIHAEMTKLLTGSSAAPILRNYPDVISSMFAGMNTEMVMRAADRLELAKNKTDSVGSEFAYALLFSELTSNDRSSAIKSLKPSRDEEKAIASICKYGNNYTDTLNIYSSRLLISQVGADIATRVILYKYALSRISDHEYSDNTALLDGISNRGDCVSLKQLAVNGGDLISLGFKNDGIGNALKLLLEKVMRDELQNSRDALISYLTEAQRK